MPWPVQNETYGSLPWLRREVGAYLGYGYNQALFDHEKIGVIDSIITSGVMRFYFPPPLPRGDGIPDHSPHQWTFLSPVASLAVAAGTATYELPSDFSGVIGEFTGQALRISVVPEVQLRQVQGSEGKTGTPLYAAIRPKKTAGGAEQGWEVVFYPTPAAAATLSYRYSVAPVELSDSNPFPLGGRQFAETILQSCLAVAEERQTKISTGPANAKYLERLAAAVQLDAQTAKSSEDSLWPLENLTTGLSINRAYLRRMIGRELGYGPNPNAWSNNQAQEVGLVLQTGLRKFYYPVPLPGERYGYEWSFLRPVSSLTTVSGQYEYDLPEDFSILESAMTFAPGDDTFYPSVEIVSEFQVRQRLQLSTSTGRPCIGAILPRGLDGAGTFYKLIVFPVADAAYTMQYRYQRNPSLGSEEAELPYGGQPHAQTIIEAVLAAAEERMGKIGMHSKLLIDRMAASIAHDQKANSQPSLGYNRDNSDRMMDPFGDHHHLQSGIVTYNGRTFDD
jgi:hypothetical protein